ncbi:MAG: sigma-70 family RNA polymerase sigma factor [Muribaculum sp.]|nr:sigma-70 family RNA polymerase sigma factor [Muribaculum sp.]
MSADKKIDIEEQYDKIYRYCYFRLHNRETAEDITQETFLRFLESGSYRDTGQVLQYLYTIARNLCIDEYRKSRTQALPGGEEAFFPEDRLLTSLALYKALSELEQEDRELLLLRYANDVPTAVIGNMYNLSRFGVYRKLSKILRKLQKKLKKEDFT